MIWRKLADKLAAYDIVIATEVGGGVVPVDAGGAGRAGKLPGGWPVCWPAGPNASYRCSAASPPF